MQKRIRRFLSLFLLFTCICGALHAQSSKVTGVVKDNSNQPIIGATIVVPGGTAGATTNNRGEYTITVPAGTKSLKFSFIGMKDQTLPITGNILNVSMKEDAIGMDEVVVVGYGTQRKSDLTGSISSVSSKVLERMPVTSTAQAITGRMAGVQITTTEGTPDAEVKIRVRGGGSITQDNSPLYIVDGFPVGSISDIAPSDISSIDVLKDASSTAIYGAQGANGVVIITTKSGKEGRVSVNLNAYWGVKKITKTLDVLDPYEYALFQYEITKGTVESVKSYERYYGVFDDMELYKSVKGTNWQDEAFGRSALQQYYNIGINGGGKAVRYNIGLTRNAEDGIMVGSGYVRNNITAKLNGTISKKFSFDFVTRFSNTVVDGAGTSAATSSGGTDTRLKHAIKFAPMEGLIKPSDSDEDDTSINETTSTFYNPLMVINDDYKKNTRNIQSYNAAVNYKIIKDLTLRTEWGAEFGNERTDRFYGMSTSQARNNGGNRPIAQIETRETTRLRTANTLTYDKRDFICDGHNLTILLGQEARTYATKSVLNESRNFSASTTASGALAMMGLGTPQPTNTFISPDDNMLSFFGRINYSGLDRYLASVSLRADGSSKFADGNRWGYFPSAAVAWRISEESFMKSTRNWMDNLKLRLSYGLAGNNRIKDNLWQMLYVSSISSNNPYYIGDTFQSQLIPDLNTGLSNKSLKWESTITRNIGLDAGFFGGRLNATFDLYWNTTKDLLINANIPANTGFRTQFQNIGQTSNRGIELTLDAVLVSKKDFTLSASFNIAMNRNRIDKLGDTKSFTVSSYWYSGGRTPDADFLIEQGQQLGLIYGYVTDGMYSFDDFNYDASNNTYSLKDKDANGKIIPNSFSTTGATFMAPGALKLRKLNDDGSATVTSADRTVIGNTNPKHTGGFSLNAAYKGFDLSVFFNWVYGNNIYNANKIEFTAYPETKRYGNLLDMMNSNHRFSYVNKATGGFISSDTELAEYNKNADIWSAAMTGTPVHSWAIEDGSFLRLNNLTLGYTLPRKLTQKIAIQTLRLYVTGYNLCTFTNYTGYDPEVDAKRSTPLTPGVDYAAFPRARSFVAGINITF